MKYNTGIQIFRHFYLFFIDNVGKTGHIIPNLVKVILLFLFLRFVTLTFMVKNLYVFDRKDDLQKNSKAWNFSEGHLPHRIGGLTT